jgi:hypothetical protein
VVARVDGDRLDTSTDHEAGEDLPRAAAVDRLAQRRFATGVEDPGSLSGSPPDDFDRVSRPAWDLLSSRVLVSYNPSRSQSWSSISQRSAFVRLPMPAAPLPTESGVLPSNAVSVSGRGAEDRCHWLPGFFPVSMTLRVRDG